MLGVGSIHTIMFKMKIIAENKVNIKEQKLCLIKLNVHTVEQNANNLTVSISNSLFLGINLKYCSLIII